MKHSIFAPLWAVMRRECLRLARRPLYWFCMVGAPLLCYLLMTTLMAQGLPTEMPLGMVDLDRTATTRMLTRNLNAFQQTRIVAQYANVSDARQAMQHGEIYGFYYIPQGTTRRLQRQERPTVSFYCNYAYLIAGSLLFRDMKTMSELASGAAAQTVLLAHGATGRQALALLQPIVVQANPIGNPWLNYNVYLTNILLPGLLMVMIFLITVYAIGTEIKENTAREWLLTARRSVITALAGKLLPHTAVFFVMGVAYNVLLYGVMRFPCHSGMGSMIGSTLTFIIASQGFGAFVAGLVPSLRLAMSVASLWGVLSFSLCGMSFPVMAMHPGLQGLTLLFPLRYYYLIYVNCALDGYSCANIWPAFAALAVFALLPLTVVRPMRRMLLTSRYVP